MTRIALLAALTAATATQPGLSAATPTIQDSPAAIALPGGVEVAVSSMAATDRLPRAAETEGGRRASTEDHPARREDCTRLGLPGMYPLAYCFPAGPAVD